MAVMPPVGSFCFVLASVLAGVSPAFGGEAAMGDEAEYYFARLDEILSEFSAREVDIRPRLKELQDLRSRYVDGASPEDLSRRREALYGSLKGSAEEIEALKTAFRSRQNLINITAFTTGVRSHLRGESQKEAARLSVKLAEYDLAFGRMNKFQMEVLRTLRDDANASRQLDIRIKRAESRRRILQVGGGFAASVLFLILIAHRGRSGRESSGSPAAPGAGSEPFIKGFRIERRIGHGARGTVYEAMDLQLERRVAVKRISDALILSSAGVQRLLREARAAASLKHPNLVEIYSVLRDGGGIFVVSEYAAGRSLQDLMDAEDKLAPRRAAVVALEVAKALDYIRARGMIHGNVQPKNILLAPGGGIKVKNAGTRGAPAYAAPESAGGAASDVFSLGVCCYEMLTGRLPFLGPNYQAQKAERFYAPPSSAGLPVAADAIFSVVLDPAPSRRYGTALAFAQALASAFV